MNPNSMEALLEKFNALFPDEERYNRQMAVHIAKELAQDHEVALVKLRNQFPVNEKNAKAYISCITPYNPEVLHKRITKFIEDALLCVGYVTVHQIAEEFSILLSQALQHTKLLKMRKRNLADPGEPPIPVRVYTKRRMEELLKSAAP